MVRKDITIHNKAMWVQQILYWRTHLDCFIVDYLGVKLKDTQRVVARAIGNSVNADIVKSRGYGKTWLISICALALGILYPGSLIFVCSKTAQQATLVLQKIDEKFTSYPTIMAEIESSGHRPVQLSKEKGICRLKNGSKIESYSIASARGQRCKILICDEAPEVKKADYDAVVGPTRNETRQVCYDADIPDYKSKAINITSACLKSNHFYSLFSDAYREMRSGNREYFACALDWRSAVRVGITEAEYFEAERKKMPDVDFAMEYGSVFVGEEADAIFPYALTEGCRTLYRAEYMQPKQSTAYYVMSVDIATSDSKTADNTVLSVIKCIEHNNGSIHKSLVYMRSYHGTRLDVLAREIRKTYVRFPNTIKIVFDTNALGDPLPQFLNTPWVDDKTGKEYPAWVCDSEPNLIKGAEPLLYAFRANNMLNQQMVNCLRVALEQRSLDMPVNSRSAGEVQEDPDNADSVIKQEIPQEEMAIFLEVDALQIEMGNLIMRISSAGNATYDVAKKNSQHKDRYSSLAMGIWYIAQREEELKKRYHQRISTTDVGIVTYFGGVNRKRR